MTDFSLEVFQNEYVPPQATSMDAIVTVTSHGLVPVTAGEAAEVLIIDISGSMYSPPGRIHSAIRAAGLAVDRIRDGVRFGIVAGNQDAAVVFPAWGPSLVVADPSSRAAAKEALRHLEPSGGTAISKWLLAARELFEASPTPRRHAILLTDGENNEVPGVLEATLERCRGLFQADCRGVGTDWAVDELRSISSALLGSVDIIRESEGLEAELQSLMQASMGRAAQASLRVWCPGGAAVTFLRQVAPAVEDLTGWGTQVDPHSRDYPLGAWGAEARDYHLSLTVPANQTGVEMLAARLSLVVDGVVVGPALVRMMWTDDGIGAGVSPAVAHYNQQVELSSAIHHGLRALQAGDERTATVRLGQATRLAATSGHAGTIRLLRKVVDVEDERTGTVRIRRNVAKADQMELDTRSTRTVRVKKDKGAELDSRTKRTVRVGGTKPPGPSGPDAADAGTWGGPR
jgi:hypothetical protein